MSNCIYSKLIYYALSHTVQHCTVALYSQIVCFSSCLFKATPLLNTRPPLISQLTHA